MTRIIIEVRGGIVQAVYATGQESDTEYLILDHDDIDNGRSPVGDIYYPDNTFEEGKSHKLWTDQSDPHEMEIRDELKRINF